ncbi:Putative uncharacterized protein [Taphrina deformans PYCC 5710]|uniref:Uncharacterized protein n=1 Tax=Taphrina deformans (strain PYCC 5710 / ATCC 11124 / CBS 356.35 / IMI 108563 / JCM 9778 / NBRC 8474) TaxID=1097556 RepID=R4XBB1_TAPDE|nr:Putative uncharacterized protein [Taphrina deformans PYCC 5710]|eukprot:CCG82890.1 Putative uncharacterized protein [Taphrina deformans PYCC 5710]
MTPSQQTSGSTSDHLKFLLRGHRWTKIIIFILCTIAYYLLFPSDSAGRQNPLGRNFTVHSFKYEISRNPKLCLKTRNTILSLTRRRRPARDYTYDHSISRTNISGWVGANNLIDGCWTYKERYHNYDKLPRTYFHHNECNLLYPPSHPERTAFNIRLTGDQIWTTDVILSIRAVVVELSWIRGFDVYILQHINSHKTFVRESVPAEFRSFTIQFTLDELIRDYDPKIVRPIVDAPERLPVMAQYNHLAETFFMRKHPQYDFAWFVEIDTRSMGPWDLFLNDIESSIHTVVPDNRRIDLLTFTPSYKVDLGWPWANSLSQFPNASLTMSLLQTHRISRALSEQMHRHHLIGRNGYFEGFMTTVATSENLNKFIYANPVFSDQVPAFTGMPFTGIAEVDVTRARLHKKNLYLGNLEAGGRYKEETKGKVLWHGATYSPAAGFSERYYGEWMESDTVCRPASLVHPVKS